MADSSRLGPWVRRFLLEHLAPEFDGFSALLLVQPMANLVASAGCLYEIQPVPAGLVTGLGYDLDDVPILKLGL